MRREDFNPQVGDIVRIRTWEDMKAEFDTDGDVIDCMFSFTPDMRRTFGDNFEFEITGIKDGKYYGHDTSFSISKDMLEPAVEEVFDETEIASFLDTMKVS